MKNRNNFVNNRLARMIYLDNGHIGYDGVSFYRLSPSKKPLGGSIPIEEVNQHVKNELEHILMKINK
jgi:hypothetical protein